MTARGAISHGQGVRIPGQLIGALLVTGSMIFAIFALVTLGPVALAIPPMVLLIVLAAAYPKIFAYVLLGGMIVIEPGTFDYTKPLSQAMWELPGGLKSVVPITTSPMELALLAVAASLFVRTRDANATPARVPRLAWAVPVVIMMGIAYGLRGGGDAPLAYNEARGLLFGMVVFVLALRMEAEPGRRALMVVSVAGTLLSFNTLARWAFYTRSGDSPVPLEFAFAHENAVFFGIMIVIASFGVMTSKTNGARMVWILQALLLLSATLVTGRRAGTLVLLVGGLTVAWMVFPKRPLAVIAVSLPIMLMGSVYLAAFWNQEYGAAAQPARAIRSQIAPSARDESSDEYRDIERANVEQTIQLNRVFGVGFGKPFAMFEPLTDLTTFWPLQQYTPHQNILWLWLKVGILGIATMLGLWIIGLKRCIEAIRIVPKSSPLPIGPIVIGATLLMYIAYAQIDQALTGTRAIAPLAIALALAFRLPTIAKEEQSE